MHTEKMLSIVVHRLRTEANFLIYTAEGMNDDDLCQTRRDICDVIDKLTRAVISINALINRRALSVPGPSH